MPACIANAVADALGIKDVTVPVTPRRIHGWLTQAEHDRYAKFEPDPWPKVQALLQAA